MRSNVRTNRTTTGAAALLLISLLALGIGSAAAQSQNTQQEIQQLRDKPQELDLMMDVTLDLKRINPKGSVNVD
jgi:hypothetical protein